MSNIKYYSINEDAARRAKEMNSFMDYIPGSATEEYKMMVDNAAKIATNQKECIRWSMTPCGSSLKILKTSSHGTCSPMDSCMTCT